MFTSRSNQMGGYDIFATVARIIGETLARCLPDEIANIYYYRPPHDVLTNVMRQSREGRAIVRRTMVLREMINKEK